MPWYKVPVSVLLEADDPKEAQDRALAMVLDSGSGPLSSAGWPVELNSAQVASGARLREIIRQGKEDAAAGNMISDPRHPGVRFSPAAAAQLAVLEFEEGAGA